MSDPFFCINKQMLSDFENKLAFFIKENNLFSASRALLAVSGGADSTALLYALCSLREKDIIKTELFCAHIDHLLRGQESDDDQQFTIQQARTLNLPITTKKIDVRSFAKANKLSIETAARQLRIKSLIGIAKENNCSLIATAHQADDNAETIIHRLLRGTGFRGLAGIWPEKTFKNNIVFIRPLLGFTRGEITAYLERRNLKWQTDKTNQDLTFKRNFIRHLLLPQLQIRCNGSLVEQLFKLSQSTHKFYNSVYSITEMLWSKTVKPEKNNVKLDMKFFSAQHPEVKIELLRKSLSCLGSGEKDLNKKHYEEIFQLAKKRVSNKRIDLPEGFIVRREYDKLVFERSERARKSKVPDETFEIQIPGKLRFGDHIIESSLRDLSEEKIKNIKSQKNRFVEQFDFDKLQPPIRIRRRAEGDRFQPLGMSSEKKVGKFLTCAKVPQDIRKKMLVVADREKIIWLWPIRISEQTRITDSTKKILQVKITDSKNTHN